MVNLFLSGNNCCHQRVHLYIPSLTKAHSGAKSKGERGKRMILGLVRIIPQPPLRFVLQRVIKQPWITTHRIQRHTNQYL